jgi:light-regulated signal transduction histidine kinase (bacteriophytochrome)
LQKFEDAEIQKLKNDCLELEEQVKLLVRTELKLHRTQAELIESKAQVEEYNRTLEQKVKERTKKLTESEKRLNEIMQELARSNKELEQFAYVASHDLQEPLRIVDSYILLMAKEGMEGKNKEYIERMQNAIKRMQNLINGLLNYSKITTAGRSFNEVDMTEIVRDVVSDLETRIRDTGGKVIIGNLPVIRADDLQMRQLFQNIIGNALKFKKPGIPPEVKVFLSGKKNTGFYSIIVDDNGIGISGKDHERIFKFFQRLHSKSEYEGSGIGLAVCKKIVERHGGKIDIVSKLNEGTKFIINLPLTIKVK